MFGPFVTLVQMVAALEALQSEDLPTVDVALRAGSERTDVDRIFAVH